MVGGGNLIDPLPFARCYSVAASTIDSHTADLAVELGLDVQCPMEIGVFDFRGVIDLECHTWRGRHFVLDPI